MIIVPTSETDATIFSPLDFHRRVPDTSPHAAERPRDSDKDKVGLLKSVDLNWLWARGVEEAQHIDNSLKISL